MNDKKILVVDDDESVLELVSFILTREGYFVLKALDMDTAMNLVRRELPDLVILDLILAKGGGIEISNELKADVRYKNIPIIIMTARTDKEYKLVCKILGAKDYVTKPFDHDDFINRVKSVLGGKQ